MEIQGVETCNWRLGKEYYWPNLLKKRTILHAAVMWSVHLEQDLSAIRPQDLNLAIFVIFFSAIAESNFYSLVYSRFWCNVLSKFGSNFTVQNFLQVVQDQQWKNSICVRIWKVIFECKIGIEYLSKKMDQYTFCIYYIAPSTWQQKTFIHLV